MTNQQRHELRGAVENWKAKGLITFTPKRTRYDNPKTFSPMERRVRRRLQIRNAMRRLRAEKKAALWKQSQNRSK